MNIIKYINEKGLYTLINYIKRTLKFDRGPYVSVVQVKDSDNASITLSAREGSLFKKTISRNLQISFSYGYDSPSNASVSITLILVNGGSKTVTWDSSIKWPSGTAPTLTASGTDMLTFVTPDSGATWYGTLVGKDLK